MVCYECVYVVVLVVFVVCVVCVDFVCGFGVCVDVVVLVYCD